MKSAQILVILNLCSPTPSKQTKIVVLHHPEGKHTHSPKAKQSYKSTLSLNLPTHNPLSYKQKPAFKTLQSYKVGIKLSTLMRTHSGDLSLKRRVCR